MGTPRVTRPFCPMRDVHPVRNTIVFTLLAVVLIACAYVWWDNREAADSIARGVRLWE